MAPPSIIQAGFNMPVTNMAVVYNQAPEDGAGWALKIAPNVPVKSKQAQYKRFDKGDQFRNEMVRRANGAKGARAGFGMTTQTTTLDWFNLGHPISDLDKGLWPLDVDRDQHAANFLQQKSLISADVLAATQLLTAGVGWGTELVGAASAVANTSVIGWSLANSTPRRDIMSALRSVQTSIGKRPNRIGISPDVIDILCQHTDFTSPVTGGATVGNEGVATVATIEKALGVAPGTIFELGTIYNTAAKGQTASMALVAPETCWIGYVPDAPSIMTPSAAYRFVYSEVDQLARDGVVGIYTYRDDDIRSDIYEADLYHSIELVAADCGYLFTSILT